MKKSSTFQQRNFNMHSNFSRETDGKGNNVFVDVNVRNESKVN